MKYKSLILVVIACLAVTAPAALAGGWHGGRGNWGGSGNWRGHGGFRGHGWRGGNCFGGSAWNFGIGFGFPFYGGFYPGYFGGYYPYTGYYPYGAYPYGGYPYGGYYGSDYQYGGYQDGGYSGNVYRGRARGDRDAALVARVQQRLARAGIYRGPIDGVLGDRTRYAIRVYERIHGLPADGRIDPRLLATMGIS